MWPYFLFWTMGVLLLLFLGSLYVLFRLRKWPREHGRDRIRLFCGMLAIVQLGLLVFCGWTFCGEWKTRWDNRLTMCFLAQGICFYMGEAPPPKQPLPPLQTFLDEGYYNLSLEKIKAANVIYLQNAQLGDVVFFRVTEDNMVDYVLLGDAGVNVSPFDESFWELLKNPPSKRKPQASKPEPIEATP